MIDASNGRLRTLNKSTKANDAANAKNKLWNESELRIAPSRKTERDQDSDCCDEDAKLRRIKRKKETAAIATFSAAGPTSRELAH